MLRVGLIGCGAIGLYIAKAIDEGLDGIELLVVFDRDIDKAVALVNKLRKVKPKIARSVKEVLSEPLDLVIEAASPEAVKSYAVDIVSTGKSIVVLSSGALLDEDLRRRLLEVSRISGAKIYVPSGAVGGLDALKAASLIGIDELVLTTRKHPKALGLSGIDRATIIFDGDVEEAVKRFPLNINVAATLMLATNRRLRVRIVADPNMNENVHEVIARGSFGEIKVEMCNKRMEENPRTSMIAALSVLQLLKQLSGEVMVLGT